MKTLPGLLALLVGGALLSAPWWSSTLPPRDYPMVAVLGVVFTAVGIFAAVPDSWPRLRTMSFSIFMGAFGLVCASLALSPRDPAPDGTWKIGGIAGFAAGGPIPWWARLVAGFFAIILLGTASLGLWGIVRDLVGGRRGDAEPPP